NARGQTLKVDMLLGQVNPVGGQRVLGKRIQHHLIDRVDVPWLACQRDPAERPDAAREERPQIAGSEDVDAEGIVDALAMCLRTYVITVIKRDGTALLEGQDGPYFGGDGGQSTALDLVRITPAHRLGLGYGHPGGNVTVAGIVCGRLVRH